jgi:hypothetical protein
MRAKMVEAGRANSNAVCLSEKGVEVLLMGHKEFLTGGLVLGIATKEPCNICPPFSALIFL